MTKLDVLAIKEAYVQDELEVLYANHLRLKKQIDKNLVSFPSRNSVRVRENAIRNLKALANHHIEWRTTCKIHSVNYAPDIGMKDLVNIMQAGTKYVKPRPFLEVFKKHIEVEFPSGKEMNMLDFSTIKKNMEDEMDAQYFREVYAILNDMPPLKYREGTPLKLTGKMYKSIRWRLVKNAS